MAFQFSDRNTPRWIIFAIDLCICLGSLMLAYQLRFNFRVPETEISLWKYAFTTVIVTRIISFLISRIYQGIIRYTSTRDALRVFYTITIGSISMGLMNVISYYAIGIYLVPFSVLIIDYFASVFSITAFRILVKTIYQELKNPTRDKQLVIIYGAGESGLITKRAIDRDANTRFKVTAFIDDDEAKEGKTVEGIRIFHTSELDQLLMANNIAHLIISIQNVAAEKKQIIIEKCLAHDVHILNVPPVTSWINGELSFKQIKKVKIEDLLERDPIRLDLDIIRKQLTDKTILITGGAGSIGSEIARQIIPFKPKSLIILDQAESPLYDLELELNESYHWKNFETVIADIRQYDRMERVFNYFRPDVVFHAAAYKHVPVMESNPSEAILTNVQGTKILADLSGKYNVEKFVMVSTDKAVNPTSIMGATKRIAEIYCQSLNKVGQTKFITTRFGNVLDSNGSVIPRFKRQVDEGGPITVTHPDIERFFMTIPEACQLVLEAGAMGNGGEIFIFDMGKSIRIVDLAKKMIKLSGLTLGKDIQIIYTGLRPGEKIFEELLANKETTLPTHHSKIMIAKVREYDFPTIEKEISDLIDLFKLQNNEVIVRKMKDIVPEYISANSQFEKLDS
ncbi:MAG: polysaccharide biosynthesis protein [Bacteroidetes bacterium]|nr:polysaccharide biosynthesis protein [Bacteroidota bacterium]MBL0032023.1 polysaccharide biosynthesis protein [Bacteroidota bacterium]MBP6428496.1 polysaccharide biosynthesis protein [Bacteroidia bacterium]